MKKLIVGLSLVLSMAISGYAAYVPPTAEQLKQAAADPTKIAALVQGATASQAASVARDAMMQVMSLDLKPGVKKARVKEIVKYLFAAYPGQALVLANALGHAIQGSALAGNSNVIATVLAAVSANSGSAGSGSSSDAAGQAFTASLTSGGSPAPSAANPGGGGASQVAAPPPPPPVASGYPGQTVQ